MIPSPAQVESLWEKYQLSSSKRRHCLLVAQVARFLADKLKARSISVNTRVLEAAALLHDIDKNVPHGAGELHPDTAVRILKQEGMEEVAALVRTHPLQAIFDPVLAPRSWEEKLLFLADKMVKQEIISVDERFRLWNDEHLPAEAQSVLDTSYPKVKRLEQEIFDLAGISTTGISQLALKAKKSTMGT